MPAKRAERTPRARSAGHRDDEASRSEEPMEDDEEATDEPVAEERTGRPPDRSDAGRLSVATAAQEGRRLIAAVTGRQPEGVTSVEPGDNGWVVEVEVLEDRHVPSSGDVLALYEVEIDADGGMLSYRRKQRYQRGRSNGGGS